jgi:hypothetical protein
MKIAVSALLCSRKSVATLQRRDAFCGEAATQWPLPLDITLSRAVPMGIMAKTRR